MREAFARVMQIALLALCLTGCSHQPTELSDEELAESYSSINQLEADNQEPINGPVTLEEAVARALKYNLDLRQRTLERVEKLKQVDSISLSQWPELVAQTRLDRRDTYSGGSSVTILPGGKSVGAESLEASTSSERRVQFADIEFSWNLLDFGLSYVRSQQAANEVMIYREEERKVMNRLMQEVRALYWMALTAQHQIPRLNKLHAKAEEALNEAQQIIDGRVEQPLEPLIYIRNLHGVKRRIEYLISDLESAKIRLGALMNLPPGTPYELAVEADYEIRKFKMETSEMERVALVNRPELRSLRKSVV